MAKISDKLRLTSGAKNYMQLNKLRLSKITKKCKEINSAFGILQNK